MKNRKTSLLLLLTLALLIGFACLPRLVSALQDSSTHNAPSYSNMTSIQLDLARERASLPIIGKLALLGKMETVDIYPSQASMTEEDVFAAAERQMAEYEAAGIFGWFDVTDRSAVPKLGIDRDDPSSYIILWTVTFSNKFFPHQALILDIDDVTGKILSIRFSVYDTFSMDGMWERNKKVMDAFTDIYFSQLGLTEAAEYAESNEAGYAYFERDGGVSSALYSFGDVIYGEIEIEFYVEGPSGFYIYFPN